MGLEWVCPTETGVSGAASLPQIYWRMWGGRTPLVPMGLGKGNGRFDQMRHQMDIAAPDQMKIAEF